MKLFAFGLFLAGGGSAALADVHYVDVNSTNATPPYTNWSTAATNIQDAVDAAVAGDEIVVTNGIYSSGGMGGNTVEVDKPLSVRSVNGAQSTIIYGGYGQRCVFLTNSASLSGFTVTGGNLDDRLGLTTTYPYGGGAYGGTLNNCTLTDNYIYDLNSGSAPAYGGGAAYCTLNNCTLTSNSVYFGSGGGAAYCTLNACALSGNSVLGGVNRGGGAYDSTLNNCTLSGNSAGYGYDRSGGGVYDCRMNNCIVYFNTAQNGPNYYNPYGIYYCCTTPQPSLGFGNITNAPLFVDTNGWANLRLQPNSPCINAGNNSYVTNATDLDGNPRISGGTVDIGAYEFQWPQLTIAPSGPNVLLSWPTNNAGYDYTGFTLQSTTNLVSPVWSTNSPGPVVIGGQNVIINPISGAQKFYRLVQ